MSITVPEGRQIAETEGLRTHGTTASARLALWETTQVWLRLERTGDDLWERLNTPDA